MSEPDDERHGGLDVRAYATLTASLRALPPERAAEALEHHGQTESTWKAAAAAWTRVIEEEMARGEHGLLLAYADALRAAEARLAEQPPALAGPEPPAPSPARDRPELPAFMIEETKAPVAKKPSPDFVFTTPVDLNAIIAAGLPFARSLERAAEPAPEPAAAKPPRAFTGTTLDLGPGRMAALPFGASDPEPPATPEAIPEPPVAKKPPADFVFTTPVDLNAIIAAGLPFARSLDPAAAPAAQPASPKPAREITGTVLDMGPERFAALPFASKEDAAQPPPPPAAPELTFEPYVALCAELTVFPQRADEILSRAQLTAASVVHVHATWRERLAADAELARRWHGLYAHYQAWFKRTTRTP